MILQGSFEIIGAGLPSNSIEHRGPLLKVSELLSKTDILSLFHACMSVYGLMKRCIGMYPRISKPLQHWACEIGSDRFEVDLERPSEYAMQEIKRRERDVRKRAPYNESNPHAYMYVSHEFSAANMHWLVTYRGCIGRATGSRRWETGRTRIWKHTQTTLLTHVIFNQICLRRLC